MIQYKKSKNDIENLINMENPGWLIKAQKRTNNFRKLGYYKESSSIWSEIKVVFMKIQHCKCAYCERQLESDDYGRIEHDLEHFRPKKKAKPWKLSKELKNIGIKLTKPLSGNADPGYHLLAYNLLNYCTSCKTCNSRLKSDYFPISGVRSSSGDDPVKLKLEEPLLINPLGNFDHDPKTLIKFYGLSPIACGKTTYKHLRGLVTIAFFKLDDLKRKYLFRERAVKIQNLYSLLQNSEHATDPTEKKTWEDLIQLNKKFSSPHTNCAQSFYDLYQSNKEEAKKIFQLATTYLKTIS